ncbi:hypothetical protein M422DRAFT_774735 [Sphaerobolus stellatus SS14]|nr:hypothetical protein M422DRAFT_774735 [Sphaerobolus stellatus SS14]
MPVSEPRHLTLTTLQVLTLLFASTAILFTITRIFIRYHQPRRLFGIDDALAFIAALGCIVASVAYYIRNLEVSLFLARTSKVFIFYTLSESFYLSAWSARLSMLFSIIRITPDGYMRQSLKGLAMTFVVFMIVLSLQIVWVCEKWQGWKDAELPICPLGLQTGLTQLVTDIIGDFVLVLIPIHLLHRTHFTRTVKVRILVLFCAAALVTIIGAAHVTFLILPAHPIEAGITAISEICVATMVCNLIVVVPFLWRKCGLFQDEEIQAPIVMSSVKFASRRASIPLTMELEDDESTPSDSQIERRVQVKTGLESRSTIE